MVIKPEIRKIFDLALYSLSVKRPFYGLFLSEIGKYLVQTKDIPTACVSKTQGSLNVDLLFNIDFLQSLSKDEILFVLAHEAQHVILEHLFTRNQFIGNPNPSMREYELFNIAADLHINQNLVSEYFTEYPKFALFPSTFPELNLKPNQGTKYYYDELKKAAKKKDESGSSGNELLDQILDKVGNKEINKNLLSDLYSGSSMNGDLSDVLSNLHNGWNELEGVSDVEKTIIQDKLKDVLESVISQIGESTIPGSLSNKIKEIQSKKLINKKPKVNWKQKIRLFKESVTDELKRRTKLRPNFRFPDSPGNRSSLKPSLIFAIDSSGSMSDKQLEEIFNEIYHAYKTGVKVRVIIWDTEIINDYIYKGASIWKREASGGTYVDPVIKLGNKSLSEFDGMIIFTDGYISMSERPKFPTLWVISKGTINEVKRIIKNPNWINMD